MKIMTKKNPPNMSETVTKSHADKKTGVVDPASVLPIADAKVGGRARVVGMMFRGNGYGENSAWITCNVNDLVEITR